MTVKVPQNKEIFGGSAAERKKSILLSTKERIAEA